MGKIPLNMYYLEVIYTHFAFLGFINMLNSIQQYVFKKSQLRTPLENLHLRLALDTLWEMAHTIISQHAEVTYSYKRYYC